MTMSITIPKEDLKWLLSATRKDSTRAWSEAIWTGRYRDRAVLVAADGCAAHVLDIEPGPGRGQSGDMTAGSDFATGLWCPPAGIVKGTARQVNAALTFYAPPNTVNRPPVVESLASMNLETRPADVFALDREFLHTLTLGGTGGVGVDGFSARLALLRRYQGRLFAGLRIQGQDLWGKDGVPSISYPNHHDRDTYVAVDRFHAALDNILLGPLVGVHLEDVLDPVAIIRKDPEDRLERLAVVMPTRIA